VLKIVNVVEMALQKVAFGHAPASVGPWESWETVAVDGPFEAKVVLKVVDAVEMALQKVAFGHAPASVESLESRETVAVD